jgi:hypothetical protein
VPFSTELRKVLIRFAKIKETAGVASHLMFPDRGGGKWHHRNARRSYYCFLKALGLPKRVPGGQGVAGSNSVIPTNFPNDCRV